MRLCMCIIKEILLYIISNLRVALPFVKIDGTLCGLSFKIRYNTVKSHYCVVLDWILNEEIARSCISMGCSFSTDDLIWSYRFVTFVCALYIGARIASLI